VEDADKGGDGGRQYGASLKNMSIKNFLKKNKKFQYIIKYSNNNAPMRVQARQLEGCLQCVNMQTRCLPDKSRGHCVRHLYLGSPGLRGKKVVFLDGTALQPGSPANRNT
jgi:hypothetical protein